MSARFVDASDDSGEAIWGGLKWLIVEGGIDVWGAKELIGNAVGEAMLGRK